MHIYLMGYRGSGKSTIANLLAQCLEWSSIDTDDWIESLRDQTIREIFNSVGESGFRDIEEQTIAQVARLTEPAVVALGGGAVLREANRRILVQTGRRVWLKAGPETLYQRIRRDPASSQRRPSLTDRNDFEEVVSLLAQRSPIYQSLAEFTVETDSRSPDEIVELIARWVHSNGETCRGRSGG